MDIHKMVVSVNPILIEVIFCYQVIDFEIIKHYVVFDIVLIFLICVVVSHKYLVQSHQIEDYKQAHIK